MSKTTGKQKGYNYPLATSKKKNVNEIITGEIISQLKKGNIPWRKSWKVYTTEEGLRIRGACNWQGKQYKGINS